MATNRRKKQRLEEMEGLNKEELKIAKYLRWNIPQKSTTIQKQQVDYFIGSKAVDTLLNSKWGNKCKKDPLFTTRDECVNFLEIMIQNKLFYRGEKVLKEEKIKKKPEEKAAKTLKKKKNEGESIKNEEKKKKRRYIINCHDYQTFEDNNDIYVWIFNPTRLRIIIGGILIMLMLVLGTVHPLWPDCLRDGLYVVSCICGCFVAGILLLGFSRSILFGIIWLMTKGRYHIWFLPNLLADVGFFDSFKPVYTIEYRGSKIVTAKDDTDDSPEEEDKETKTKSEVEEDTGSDFEIINPTTASNKKED